MSDYLQDTEKAFFEEMVNANIVARDGEILNKENYIKWLNQKQENIRSQIQQIPEPGDVYDRYRADLLYKDMEIVRTMLRRQTDTTKSAAQEKSENRESELMNKKSVFVRALESLRKKNKIKPMPQNENNR